MPLGVQDFERWWPEVARRLTGALARRGVRGQDAEDVVQETALRALAASPPVASPDELARWSFTVARRIEIDRVRRRSRAELVAGELARSRPAAADTARAAESRVALATAAKGLAALSASDRAALLAVLDDEDGAVAVDRRTAVREAVRRHRARLRLVAVVGKLVGAGTAAVHVLRRTAHKLRPTHAELGFVVAVGGALLAAPVVTGPAAAAPSSPALAAAPAVDASDVVAADTVAAAPSPPNGFAPTRSVPTTTVPVAGPPASDVPPPLDPGRTKRITFPVDPGTPGGGTENRFGLQNFEMQGVAAVYTDEAAWCAATTPGPTCEDYVRVRDRRVR